MFNKSSSRSEQTETKQLKQLICVMPPQRNSPSNIPDSIVRLAACKKEESTLSVSPEAVPLPKESFPHLLVDKLAWFWWRQRMKEPGEEHFLVPRGPACLLMLELVKRQKGGGAERQEGS